MPDMTKPEPGGLPEPPTLGGPQGDDEEREAPLTEPSPTVMTQEAPIPKPPVPFAEDPKHRYWTEDRLIRMGMTGLFAIFAVGLVIALAAWPVIVNVPFLPWLVGTAILASPAWRAYMELAEESKARRTRDEQVKHGLGVVIVPPEDRHQS